MMATDKEKRMECIKKHFSKEIMHLFSEGVPEDYFGEKEISYEEAVAILQHTISEVKKRPVLF